MTLVFCAAFFSAVFVYAMCIWGLSWAFSNRIITKQRLDETENLDNLTNVEEESSFSLGKAVIQPLITSLINVFLVFVPNNEDYLKKTELQLREAGIKMDARSFKAATGLAMVAMAVLGGVLGYVMESTLKNIGLGILVGILGGYTMSRFALTSRITKRNEEIHHEMPEMMDLLSVSVSAGLGFDQALAYVVQKSEGALFDEIAIAQREITLGRSRREALNSLAERCGNLEMKTFVSAVLQADEMGASMQNVLQIQADTIRLAHKQAVEESAQKLSVKMLIPLVTCIFPVILIVLMGPAFMSIAENLMS
ncbi:MAG: type II secretion system F family protein [Oscillospiraceae bacterium]|nr:type II secretion system F family protein [Oscillospiraceae bacterium]